MANRTGPKTPPVVLSDELRPFPESEVCRQSTPQGKATRFRIILGCADGLSNMEVARRLGVSFPKVGTRRRRFLKDGVEGLSDESRPERPPICSQEDVKEVVSKTIRDRPVNATSWSLRMMTGESDISNTNVWRIWGKFNLKPYRFRSFKPTDDEEAKEKMRAIFELYRNSPKDSILLSLDEMTGI